MKSLIKRIFEHGDDRGIGLEPLLAEFVWNEYGLSDEQRKERERKITGYYQKIYRTSKSLYKAYGVTREWAKSIFVTPYVKRTLDKYKEQE